MQVRDYLWIFAGACLAATVSSCSSPSGVVEGTLRVWYTASVTFQGPASSQEADHPNPFLDYRLQVVFTGPSGREYNVPGYFDGDGRGGAAGSVWCAHFTPDEPGEWRYRVFFHQGEEVAISLDPDAGTPAAFDGAEGSFQVGPRDPDASGFHQHGRLEYAGEHYLKFRDGGYWIKGGVDSPENLLAYSGFDNTTPSHSYADHEEDWRPGDPDWSGGHGKAIIGALSYLASRHVNSVYFLTMNIGGDGKDVWPWAGQPDPEGSPGNDNLHFDLAKLRQWETVFDHAQNLGIFLHFVFNEAEEPNKRELDDGELGVERKLYYRELIARFSHHNALQWNLCEEYNIQFDFGPERVRDFARYVGELDPYNHPVTVHSAGDPLQKLRFTFGDPLFSITSIQLNQRRIDTLVEEFRQETAAAGRPLPVSTDEFTVDAGQEKSWFPIDDPDLLRKQKLWPTYLSGGNIEFITQELLNTESFKKPSLDKLWRYTWYARKFMEDNLPFWEMEPADQLASSGGTIGVGLGKGRLFQLGAQVFAKPGEVYAVYLPRADPAGKLDLSGATGVFRLRWYNPRTGHFEGGVGTVAGGSSITLGAPPSDPHEDWAVLLKRPPESASAVFPGSE